MRYPAVGLLLLALPWFQGCDVKSLSTDHGTTTVMVLFDLSGSTGSQAVRGRYLEQLQTIVASLEPGTRVVADLITESPLAQSSFPINHQLPRMDPLNDNRLAWEKHLETTKEEIVSLAAEILSDSTHEAQHTPIIEATQLAERVFNTYEADSNVLVIFSDMVEESELGDFTKPLDENGASGELASLQAAKRVPELNGVKVHVVGAASGTYEGMSLRQREAIRAFWLDYFTAAGADADRDRYGSAILEF